MPRTGPLRKLFQANNWASSELKKNLAAGMSKTAAIAAVKRDGQQKFGADWSKLWTVLLPILMKLLEAWLKV